MSRRTGRRRVRDIPEIPETRIGSARPHARTPAPAPRRSASTREPSRPSSSRNAPQKKRLPKSQRPAAKTRRESEKRGVHRSVVACRRGLARARSRPGFEARRWWWRPQAFVGERRGVRGVRGVRGLPRSAPLGVCFSVSRDALPLRRGGGFIPPRARLHSRCGASRKETPARPAARLGVVAVFGSARPGSSSLAVRAISPDVPKARPTLTSSSDSDSSSSDSDSDSEPFAEPRPRSAATRTRSRRSREETALVGFDPARRSDAARGRRRVGNAGGSRGDALLRARGGRPRGLGRCGVGREATSHARSRGVQPGRRRRLGGLEHFGRTRGRTRGSDRLGHQRRARPHSKRSSSCARLSRSGASARPSGSRGDASRRAARARREPRAGDFGHARPARVTASWSYRSAS